MQMQSPISMQSGQQQPRFYSSPKFQGSYQKTNNFYNSGSSFRQPAPQGGQNVGGQGGGGGQGVEFDGKRLRKAVVRKTIDYNSAIVKQLELRVWQRDHRDYRAIQPDTAYAPEMPPPPYLVYNPINSVTTKFVRTSTNKMRCPIFCVAWTPEGRRLVTGASSGEFTLWNGLTFNFETILQAHDSPVRCMVWSHNDQWMVTGDHSGFVKYWQSNMNNVKMFQAHKEPLRGISFCPTDHKFATCSDDGTVRIWDFARCHEERILRGHGADVKCLAWHPHKGLLVSGSKDSQQPIKLWDPKSGQSLATLHAHKSTVMEAKWNENGNWLITGSRDHLIKLFDIRKLSQEVQTFRGHKKEVTSLAWHPVHESLFASGGSDGAVMFWLSGVDKEVGSMEQAHDSIVWALAWHPLGHILCSGSNDHTCKFWTRNRPGDKMRDKYNLNIMSSGNPEDAAEYDEVSISAVIPGMGMENSLIKTEPVDQEVDAAIPGLDFGSEEPSMGLDSKMFSMKKVPYAKPIPRQFQQQWMDNKRPLLVAPPPGTPAPAGTNLLIPPPTGAPTMPPPPPQSIPPGMMPPPPTIPNFPPPTHMMPPSGDQPGGPRMPPPPTTIPPPSMPPPAGNMMWPPLGPPGPVGNGSQFMPPPPPLNHPIANNTGMNQFAGAPPNTNTNNMNNNSSNNNMQGPPPPPQSRMGDFPKNNNESAEPKSWKDYGDNDLRLQLDSDMRMLGGGAAAAVLPEGRGDTFGSDQDMRARMQDTDARVPQFNNNFPPPGGPPGGDMMMSKDRGGRPNRAGGGSRWGPTGGGNERGQFHQGGLNSQRMGSEGDWDERMGPPMSEGGVGGQKRPWDDGPGSYGDSQGDEHYGPPPGHGMMGGPPPHHFNPQGNRGGPPHWQRGGGPRGRFPSPYRGPYRGGPPRGGRGGPWEH